MAEDEKEKGFTIRDKRHFVEEKEDEDQDGQQPEQEAEGENQRPQQQERTEANRSAPPLPEINFSNFIFSLSTSALIQLGEIADPVTREPAKDLALAKQTVDILGMLHEKTKGNLTSDEEALITNVLYDLRMRYVKAKG